MVYNYNEFLNGFCKNKKIKSVPLYIFKDIKSFNSTKLISEKQKNFLNSSFLSNLQNFGFFPDEQFDLGGAIAIVKKSHEPKKSLIDQAAKLSQKLPKKKWSLQFIDEFEHDEKLSFILGWGLSFYNFSIKKTDENFDEKQSLCLSQCKTMISKNSLEKCFAEIRGIFLARDLINLPPNILIPYNYEKIIKNTFKKFSPKILVYKDKELEKNFPLVDFVGRSSENKPLLIDLRWNKNKKNNYPNIVLVGKGVTFDSGGLDIKPSNSMLLMKKGMGGSAAVLGIAYALMSINCPVNLRVI